jgi:hypothetical protein
MPALSGVPITGNDATLTISDGAALTLVIPLTNGDLKLAGFNAGMKNARLTCMQEVTDFYARGKYTGSKFTKGKILEGSFTGQLQGLLGVAGAPTALDTIMKAIDWAAATSTLPASMGDVPHFKLTWSFERSDYGTGVADGTLVLKYCEFTYDIAEGDEGSTFTINFKLKPHSTDSIVVT